MAQDIRDIPGTSFTVTNWTNDTTLDCDSCNDACLADVLGTLIKTLQEQGILEGTTSA